MVVPAVKVRHGCYITVAEKILFRVGVPGTIKAGAVIFRCASDIWMPQWQDWASKACVPAKEPPPTEPSTREGYHGSEGRQ